MGDRVMQNRVRERRTASGLSQAQLATRVDVSRQALSAIEAGRQVPSTHLALHLARALECSVEELFQLRDGKRVEARCPDGTASGSRRQPQDHSGRVIVGSVGGELIAHRIDDPGHAADGLIRGPGSRRGTSAIDLLCTAEDVESNVLVAGCAPLLGIHAERLTRRYRHARASWIQADSSASLRLLAAGHVHVAGVHLADANDAEPHVRAARTAIPGERSVLVNLARWRQGLVVAPGNPLGVSVGPELLRPGLRFALRDPGSGAQRLLERTLRDAGRRHETGGTYASDHRDVARLVKWGVVDLGVAIESVAIAEGLEFIALAEERFDLIVPESLLLDRTVGRFLETIDQSSFRAEAERLPGYDLSVSGHVATVDAA